MQNWSNTFSWFSHKSAWLWTILCTVAMFIWFAASTDLASLGSALRAAGPTLLLFVLGCYTLNAVLVIVWLNLVSQKHDGGRSAFRVGGWFMLATIVLPIRLSELAWIYLMHRWLDLPPARAVFVALYHRLLDFFLFASFSSRLASLPGRRYWARMSGFL